MENGTIFEAMSFGVGRIRAERGDTVVFTARVFDGPWATAVVGRGVSFIRYVNSNEAKRVIGR